ncbi:uncharacterized protein J4E88_005450 [Alternaria novae-zelandiae]|uniref:uncharacterized protein n=1 Tax=Alternaria metachromatica TaxID=283354 RepID=UPI0020C224BB|nr:uncharacterized protein J4E83_002320 [Alternaria metachromatica]XP_049225154.1 uncharacterized protein J4E78_001909 [Alternaria triticimaculans]XP_049232804.1 uncharacterized protein J4E87_005568 [Alternaria ethzedia]XP_049248596.1 uncharacterized protein J4E84_000437 [Alternaria hordeiaustralica]XP_049254877.1 uncharacterized protein J4E88_005450 [Alternaria novae-zelandiae]KAI4705298.1 hypothetical protein J4E81_000178 [Alternaria sp. BMP 2799]KAI4711890.1 hypothetical protein J4E89_0033
MADAAPANDSNGGSSTLNPFAKRTSHSDQSILLYKITTTISWLLLVISAIYTTFAAPSGPHSHKFWHNNPQTPFAQSSIFTSIYVLIIFILQGGYAYALYMSDETYVTAAANLGSHFIANNLLLFGFVHLFTRSHFWLALFLLVLNFGNLSLAYFRHSAAPRTIHVGTVSGPLAWNFVALYWVGAIAVHSNHFAARIVANVFIWGWLGYGMFFLVAYKDYTMGFALSVLAFSTGVGQFLTRPHLLQLQWIFAFSIGGLLFLLSLAVGMPGLLGRDPFPRGQIVSEDRERAPLLADD